MSKNVLILTLCFIFFTFASYAFTEEIIWQEIGRGNLNLNTVVVDKDDPNVIYTGSNNAVLKTDDAGENWRSVLLIKGQKRAVNFLIFGQTDKNSIYAATQSGLYYSNNNGRYWKRIFRGKNLLENDCLSVAVNSKNIYLGTKSGLFISEDSGRSWQSIRGKLINSRVYSIYLDARLEACIYIACSEGVFKSMDNGKSWERVFIAAAPELTDSDADAVSDEQDVDETSSEIRRIAIDYSNNYIYLADSGSIYRSIDRGITWQTLSDYGLLNKKIKFLAVSNGSVYAVLKSGIFKHSQERWQELSLGLAAEDIRHLTFDKQGNLYIACDKGLFKSKVLVYENKETIIEKCYEDEPDIDEVMRAAINYAEVDAKKIIEWRKQAKNKAFLPKVSAGINRDISDLWHWESGSTTKSGDDILVRGRETVGWDVTLSWDLSEIIWNTDQTSIDVRSRLMVELRDEILDEVIKLYFERLRIKKEIDTLSFEERRKRFEKELRLRELTAMLNGLTDGYFSNAVKRKRVPF